MQPKPYNEDEAKDATGPREPGIGKVLEQARIAQGLSIDDVADQLKFGARQIQALEEGRFEDLPGSTFARGMVRGYARLLKLEAGPLLEQLEGKFEVPDSNRLLARYRQPVPFSDNSRRSNFAYAALSIVVLAVVAAVAFEWQQERKNAGRLAFVPAARAPLESASPAAASATSVPPVNVSAVTAGKPAEVSAPAMPKRATTPPEKPVAEALVKPPAAVAPAPVAIAAPKAPAESSGPRIVMRFEEESWVEVYDGSGRALMAQLNPAGSVRVVRGEPPFSLVIGNAQHVQVVYEDKIVDLTPHIRVEVARLTLK